jgi:hypothetical protein
MRQLPLQRAQRHGTGVEAVDERRRVERGIGDRRGGDLLENLYARRMARGAEDASIASQQRGIQQLGERDIRGVVGGQVGAECPDPGKQKVVGMALQREVGEILERLARSPRIHGSLPNESSQHLSHFQV